MEVMQAKDELIQYHTDIHGHGVVKRRKESVTIWPVYSYTLAAQNTVIKLLMLILYVEDNTSMSYEEIHA